MEINNYLVRMLKEKYSLSHNEAHKISVIISQLHLGYVLTIYPQKTLADIMNGQEKIFNITSNFYDTTGKTYNFIAKDMNFNAMLDNTGTEIRQVVSLDELIPMFQQVCPNRKLTLSMDFEWDELDLQ